MKRLAWIDAAKGIAIFLVVLGHAWDALGNKGLINPETHYWYLNQLSRYHMPLFFMVAGLFAIPSLEKSDTKRYAHKQFWQLLYPMFVWYYIFLGAKLIAGSLVNQPSQFSMLFEFPAPGHWHYWFLWALLLIRIAIYFAKPLLRFNAYSYLFILGLSIAIASTVSMADIEWVDHWFGPAIAFSPYFFLGMILGKYLPLIRINGYGQVIAGFCFLSACFVSATHSELPELLVYPISMTLGLSTIYILIWLSENVANSLTLIARLGFLSMPVYLAHPIFTAIAREILLAIGVVNVPVQLAIGTLSGIFVSLLIYFVAVKTKLDLPMGFSIPKQK